MRKKRERASAVSWKIPFLQLWRRYSCWELGAMVLGALSLVGIIVILFVPVGKGPTVMVADGSVPPVTTPAFNAFVSQSMTLPLDTAPRPEVLENGDRIIPKLLADIDGAKQSISFMAYIWKDGKLSNIILDHLTRRQRAGVQVRILLDAYGALHAPSSKLKELQEIGGKVATFHSLVPAPWTIMRSTKRDHRRAIIVDGEVGYTGGLGVDDVWLGDAKPPQWHDLMFRVKGSMARRLQGSFAELWAVTTGEVITAFPAEGVGGANIPYLTLSTSPSPDLFEDETFLLLSLSGATRSIKIETPYFLPDATIRKVLIDKAKSGVDVTVLVPNNNTDEKSVRWAGQRVYEELLQAGVKIYEYQPTFTHTKLLVEDGFWSVIGSANMDIRSRRLNDEVVLGVQDPVLAKTLSDIYGRDLTRSKQILLKDWKRRGLFQRALELLSQAFVQQY